MRGFVSIAGGFSQRVSRVAHVNDCVEEWKWLIGLTEVSSCLCVCFYM